MTTTIGWFDRRRRQPFTCPGCGWQGLLEDADSELFERSFLLVYRCPPCDGPLAHIPLPDEAEVRMAARRGDAEALEMIQDMERASE